MSVRIKLVFDGDSQALKGHRLSVSEMGPAIGNLLIALRRTASAIGSETAETSEDYGARGGRFTRMAEGLDLQIESIEAGSVGLGVQCVQAQAPDGQLDMWFARQAAMRLVGAIDDEAHGRVASAAARRYLDSLPPSVLRQRYTVFDGDEEVMSAEFEAFNTPKLPPPRAQFLVFEATIAKFTVEPGKESLELKRNDSDRRVRLSVTPAQIEEAIAARREVVRVTAIVGESSRLLRLDLATKQISESHEDRVAVLRERWEHTLRELAK